MEKLTFCIPTLFGLEGICANELRKLGYQDVRTQDRRVFCSGTLADVPKLNYALRTGERVRIVLDEFFAGTFDAVFETVKQLPLSNFIPRDGQFPVAGHSLDSTITSVPALQRSIKKAAAENLGKAYGVSTLPETGGLYQLEFMILKDNCTLMLDTTGQGLHKRGYRANAMEAPLRETLAAAMVILSGYRGRDMLLDPFCGSGTIPIEAAMIAKNQAPGLLRHFSAESFPYVPKKLWMAAKEELRAKEFERRYPIVGADSDLSAIQLAQDNARKAGVDDTITFVKKDVSEHSFDLDYGKLVTNPPYGERMLEQEEAAAVTKKLGDMYRRLPKTWSGYVISSHEGFEGAFGRGADKKRKLYNGRLKCELFMFDKK